MGTNRAKSPCVRVYNHLHSTDIKVMPIIDPFTTITSTNFLTQKPLKYFMALHVESAQDFLMKSGIKPLMHLFEISTFSLNNVIIRLTKNYEESRQKLGSFLVNKVL